MPEFACALSADHDDLRWTILPEDLRRLYGLEVTEEIVWSPLLEPVSIDAPGWIPLGRLLSSPGGGTVQRAAATIL